MPWRHVGEWRYSSTFLDLGTVWRGVVSLTPRPLYPPGKQPPIRIEYEACWAPEMVWTLWRREKSYPCREWNPDFQPVAHCSTDWAIPTSLPLLSVCKENSHIWTVAIWHKFSPNYLHKNWRKSHRSCWISKWFMWHVSGGVLAVL
jgi:hypothetical protein